MKDYTCKIMSMYNSSSSKMILLTGNRPSYWSFSFRIKIFTWHERTNSMNVDNVLFREHLCNLRSKHMNVPLYSTSFGCLRYCRCPTTFSATRSDVSQPWPCMERNYKSICKVGIGITLLRVFLNIFSHIFDISVVPLHNTSSWQFLYCFTLIDNYKIIRLN